MTRQDLLYVCPFFSRQAPGLRSVDRRKAQEEKEDAADTVYTGMLEKMLATDACDS